MIPSLSSTTIAFDLRKNRILFYASVAGTILFAVTVAVVSLVHQRHMAEAQAIISAQNLAQTVELSIEGMIDKIDVSLHASADEIARQLAGGKPNSNLITDYLLKQQQRLPGVAYVRATNERGDIVYGPGVLKPLVNQADRNFFFLQRDNPALGLFVEKPLFARINKTWVWPFSRRINKPDGSFGGVVFASIKLELFEEQFSRVNLGENGRIALRYSDIGLMASYPPLNSLNRPIGHNKMPSAFTDAMRENRLRGTYRSGNESNDGISRLHAYSASEKYGFLVNVGLSRDAVLAEWKKQAWLMGGLVAILLTMLLLGSGVIMRAWQHQAEDVLNLLASQQALSLAKEQAESANRAKSEFLASMSHELRTPLNSTLCFAQLMSMDETLSEQNRQNAREIEQAGNHLLHIVNDMIDLARIESGRLALTMEPVPVKTVLDDCIAMTDTLAEKKNIRLIVEAKLDARTKVQADYVRLRQVVLNLLTNAYKYNTPGGQVTLAATVNGGVVQISVTDTGLGIAADKQHRIFNSFDRLGREAGAEEGTGIGLVITKRIMDAMGGRIGFESVEGKGSTFWVELAVSTAESQVST